MYIFQSEQVIKLRFWLKNNLADISFARSLSPLWGAMGDAYTPKPTNSAELKTALLQYGMICHRSSLIRQPCDFERDFDFALLQLVDILNTEFKYQEGSWHSLLKHLKCWQKSFAKFDSLLSETYWISRTRPHVHLTKWTLKFKLLYLLNRICYFNKICRICGLNPHL